MSDTLARLTIDVHSVGHSSREDLIADVRRGLLLPQKELPPRWFYDERGSRLFDEITGLPEYYQTRTEAAILDEHADEIARVVRPESIVELGAGSCTKSRILIEAGRRRGTLTSFIPFDISESALREAGSELLEEFPGLTVHALVGDFATHLGLIPRHGRQLVVFLGSTLGNFEPAERAAFLDQVRELLAPEDAFLLGLDLVKPLTELLPAYDDAGGVTATFNLNLIAVLNRELGAALEPGAFRHVARYDGERDRIEMHLESTVDQIVDIPAAQVHTRLAAGETIRTEISAKFTPGSAERMLSESGMRIDRWFTDSDRRFAVLLASPAPDHRHPAP